MLHNFGGNIEMYGILDAISSGPVEARVSANSTMVPRIFLVLHIGILSIMISAIIHKFAFVRSLNGSYLQCGLMQISCG